MKLSKHILFERKYTNDGEAHLKLKVLEGFYRSDISNALDVKDNWTPLPLKNKLYFFPGCNVPRFKVREHYAVTIKPEKATAAFVGKNSMVGSESTFTHYKNLHPITYDEAHAVTSHLKDEHIEPLFLSLYANNNIKSICLEEELWYNSFYERGFFKSSDDHFSSFIEASRYVIKMNKGDNGNQLLTYKNNSEVSKMTCDIYHEEALLKLLNVSNLELDEEKYDELRAFGLTKEKENIVLMMELMNNCDFEKSVVYLLFLLKEFGQEIYPLKESSHVNFKSLLSYLRIDRSNIGRIDINDMTRILRDHQKFTRKNAQRISTLFQHDHMNYEDSSNVCWTSGPILRSDCETLLNKDND